MPPLAGRHKVDSMSFYKAGHAQHLQRLDEFLLGQVNLTIRGLLRVAATKAEREEDFVVVHWARAQRKNISSRVRVSSCGNINLWHHSSFQSFPKSGLTDLWFIVQKFLTQKNRGRVQVRKYWTGFCELHPYRDPRAHYPRGFDPDPRPRVASDLGLYPLTTFNIIGIMASLVFNDINDLASSPSSHRGIDTRCCVIIGMDQCAQGRASRMVHRLRIAGA